MEDKEKKVKEENCECEHCECNDEHECECNEEHCECSEDCKCEDGKCECEDCECDDEGCDCGEEHVHDENCNHEQHDPRYEYILALEADLKEAEEKVLRAKADMINYRKRMEEEQTRMFKYVNEEVAKKLLPIIDNFERAVNMDNANMEDEVSKFLIGFKMIKHDFSKVLSEIEVKEIEALGKEFDPTYHEAIVVEKGEKPGIVLEVLQKGYILKDKVIRPSLVKVSE